MSRDALRDTLRSVAGVLVLTITPSWAAITPQEAERLGNELTPVGAQKAANADGTIPAWDGGLTSAAAARAPNFRAGGHHPDPYASDKPLFTITPANMGEHAAKLTEGHKRLLETYKNTYRMHVYPTHRSAAFPQHIYE